MSAHEHFEANRRNWDERSHLHATSAGLRVTYPYFETDAPMVFDDETTYVTHDDTITNTRTYEWNHGLGEIFTALTRHGLRVTLLEEHRGLEWKMFDHMVEEDGRWKLPSEQRDFVPMMYSLMAVKPNAAS